MSTKDGDHEALTYVATRKDSALKPYPWYIEHVVRGAGELQLPDEYIARISMAPTAVDPVAERSRSELSIYDAG